MGIQFFRFLRWGLANNYQNSIFSKWMAMTFLPQILMFYELRKYVLPMRIHWDNKYLKYQNEAKKAEVYLSQIFHDKGSLNNLLFSFDAPATSILSFEDGQLDSTSQLDNSIPAFIIACTLYVTFIDCRTWNIR